ncbi:MAG TPA: YdjY domain-containing protein [Planctomycetota bacterium]|nr:YdjY domain-containing protein [Planctomycetota bacterium]
MRQLRVGLLCSALFTFCAMASDVSALVKKLASENEEERAAAIAELKKLGDAAQQALAKIEVTESLQPQQLVIVRKFLGELQVQKSALKPVDLGELTPFMADAEKGKTGDPNILINKDKKLVVMNGDFALEQGPLEFLVVTRGPNARLHETIVAVQARPRDICWALLACAYTYAGELGEDGKINLPKDAGVMISVEFLWESPHANMDTGIDIPRLFAGFKLKEAQLEKLKGADRANLLLDMDTDLHFLRHMLDRDLSDSGGKFLARSPFAEKEMQDPRLIYDDAKRKAIIAACEEYIPKMPKQPGAAELKGMPVLPEKKVVRVPIEFFAWNSQTEKVMKRAPFAFTGSKFERDPETKKMIFKADEEKSIVAVKLDPYAILNTPLDMRNADPQHDAGYSVNRHLIPKRGTRCRLVFEPWAGGELKGEDLKDTGDKKAPPAPPPTQQQ